QGVDGRARSEAADVEGLAGRMKLASRDGEGPDAGNVVDDLIQPGLRRGLDLLAVQHRRADIELLDVGASAGADGDRRQGRWWRSDCRGVGETQAAFMLLGRHGNGA